MIAQFKNKSSGKIGFSEALSTSIYTDNRPKTTDRFLHDVIIDGVTYPKLPELFIYSTLEGKKFFIEWEKSVKENTAVGRNNFWFPVVLMLGLLGGLSGVISLVYTLIEKNSMNYQHKSQPIQMDKGHSNIDSRSIIQKSDSL